MPAKGRAIGRSKHARCAFGSPPISLGPSLFAGTTERSSYAASAFAGFSGGVIAPDVLISASSLAE